MKNDDLSNIPFYSFLFFFILFLFFFIDIIIITWNMVVDAYSFFLKIVSIIQKKNKMDNKKE